MGYHYLETVDVNGWASFYSVSCSLYSVLILSRSDTKIKLVSDT